MDEYSACTHTGHAPSDILCWVAMFCKRVNALKIDHEIYLRIPFLQGNMLWVITLYIS